MCSLFFAAHTKQNSKLPSTIMRQQQPGKRKAVAFSTVEIHHHKLILGDHPSVSDGVPLTLDWSVEYTEAIDLDSHEQNRQCRSGLFFMESSEREQLARNNGASEACLIETRRELSIIQSSRRLSELDQPWGLWESSGTSDSSCYQHQRCGILLYL